MNIHSFQHIQHEDLAYINTWAHEKQHTVTTTHWYRGEEAPPLETIDWLIVMGGPMNVYEEDLYPWLAEEKRYIRRAIEQKKRVLGICLGAQLIATVLGGVVTKNRYKEIGWFPVSLTDESKAAHIFNTFPAVFTPLHWHGDTFSIPHGAIHLARSQGCEHQAFEYASGRVVGLQFHLEITPDAIASWLTASHQDLKTPGPYVHSPQEIQSLQNYAGRSMVIMKHILEHMEHLLRS